MDDNAIDYNLLIVGQKGVGKFSLHYQFVHDLFPSVYDPFFDDASEQNIKECLWKHTEGRKSTTFRVMPKREELHRPGEYRPVTVDQSANGMVLVYRINSATTFEAIKEYVKIQKRENGGTLSPKPLALVGNMSDCRRKERKILCIEAEEFAADLGCIFVETSAKDSKGIDKLKQAALAKMATQKDELISLELGLIARKPRSKVIQGSDRAARETFERRNSLVGRLSALRVTRVPRKKKSDHSLSSRTNTITSISEDPHETASEDRTSTLTTVQESPTQASDAGSESSSVPPSPQSDSSGFSNFSSVSSHTSSSSQSSAKSRNSSETSADDMSTYTLYKAAEINDHQPLPSLPTGHGLRPPMVLHETPIDSLDAVLKGNYNPCNRCSHKRNDSLEPDKPAEDAVSTGSETPKMTPKPEEWTSHIANIALRQNSQPQIQPPLHQHPVMASSPPTTINTSAPPPALPTRSPRRGYSRPNSVIDNHPAMPSRSPSARSTTTTASGNIGLVLPPLSREAAAMARQNILLQIAALMQTQTQQEELQQEAVETIADAGLNPHGWTHDPAASLDLGGRADDDALRLEEEIVALKERLRQAERRKAMLQHSPPMPSHEGFSADHRLGPILANPASHTPLGISV